MRAIVAVVLGFVIVASMVPGVAAAQETRTGGSVVVGEGETVAGGLTAMGGTVVVQGTVDGDLTAYAGDVVVTGTVTGDVSASAGNVRIDGTVGGDVAVAAGAVLLGPDAEIGGDLSAAGTSVVLAGTVHGNVAMGGDSLTIERTAVVDGTVEYDGTLNRVEGATVGGAITDNPNLDVAAPGFGGRLPRLGGVVVDVWQLLAGFVMGAVLLVLVPEFSKGVLDRALDSPLKSGGAGILTLVAVPVLLVIFAITIIGIPLAVITAMLFVPLVLVAIIYGAFVVGTWLLSLADVDNRWIALFVGLVVMILVDLVPWLGGLVQLVVFVLGLGAVTLALYGGFKRQRAASAA